MTLGEKIAKQRKELNYTQEQLADILGVSRQSISKWESDIAYPETDKLIKMGKLFDCSMDYLLNEDITEKQDIKPKETETLWDKIKKQFHERNLKRKIVIGICIILMILFIGAIYDSWCDIWHEFGENLYHMFNK